MTNVINIAESLEIKKEASRWEYLKSYFYSEILPGLTEQERYDLVGAMESGDFEGCLAATEPSLHREYIRKVNQ